MRDDRILLGLRARDRKNFPNCWAALGGHLEAGETPEQAAIREISEELGVGVTQLIKLDALRLVTSGRTYCFHMFAARTWTGGEPSVQNAEHSEIGWFSMEEACALSPLAFEEYREVFRNLPY